MPKKKITPEERLIKLGGQIVDAGPFTIPGEGIEKIRFYIDDPTPMDADEKGGCFTASIMVEWEDE